MQRKRRTKKRENKIDFFFTSEMSIIDGQKLAAQIRLGIKKEIQQLKITPHLAVVQVADRSDSSMYIRMKEKAAREVGIKFSHFKLNSNEEEIIKTINLLNQDSNVHGILVQLPLPKEINQTRVTDAVLPEKDVDGFHSFNLAKLCRRETPIFEPCTPKGILELLKSHDVELEGKFCVIIGRSNVVGMPLFHLLQRENATVCLCHSKTLNLSCLVKQADVLISAAGSPNLVRGSWIKKNAVVVDVGINSLNQKLVGDCCFDEVIQEASLVTPVPGGVGPMTICMLMKNTLIAAKSHK